MAAVDPRLLLHDRYHGQVDLVNGETVQVSIQQDVQLQPEPFPSIPI